MSDNFVRRNLKRRSTFKYKKSRRKTPVNRDDNYVAEEESGNSDHDTSSTKRFDQKDGNHSMVGGGLASWGMDPLTLSLDFLQKHRSAVETSVSKEKTAQIADFRMDEEEAKVVRGLNVVDNKVVDKKKMLNIAFLGDSRKFTSEMLTLLEQYAPKCSGHQMPARILTVNKSGKNKVKLIELSGGTVPTNPYYFARRVEDFTGVLILLINVVSTFYGQR